MEYVCRKRGKADDQVMVLMIYSKNMVLEISLAVLIEMFERS